MTCTNNYGAALSYRNNCATLEQAPRGLSTTAELLA